MKNEVEATSVDGESICVSLSDCLCLCLSIQQQEIARLG